MGHLRIHFLLCITFLFVIFTSGEAETISSTESQTIQNLRAFAKLYGYVKYFHPSDEASAIDWDKFAIYGAKQVKDAQNTQELKAALEGLFLPIAPTIQIYTSGQKSEDPMKHVPDDTTGLKIVAWQHQGVYLNTASVYRSVRLNRKNKFLLSRFGAVTQSIDATDYRGSKIKLRVFVRTNVSGSGNQVSLFLRIDRENAIADYFDDMEGLPTESEYWEAYEIVGDVAEDATIIYFGCYRIGAGQVCVDEFQLFSKREKDEWEAIEIENPGFEEADDSSKSKMWRDDSRRNTWKITTADPYKGNKCLLIEDRSEIFSGKLFEEYPKVGEVVNKPLGAGLFCQIPLALYSDENGTLGKSEKHSLSKLLEKLEAVDAGKLIADDEDVRLADVVIAWNVFQHFYPYFDVVDVDWDSELTNALRRALTDKNERDFYYTLCRFIAKLEDGHGSVSHKIQLEWTGLPFCVDWIEDQVVVIASKEPTNVKIGDVIVSIDGIEAKQALLNEEEYISGSRQSKRHEALVLFGYGDKGTKANLVIKRGDETFESEVERMHLSSVAEVAKNYRNHIFELRRPKIDKIRDDIFYVDLTRAKMGEIKKTINDIANAKGVIFDLRGYPKQYENRKIICHLLREKTTSAVWIRVPHIIYPDLEKVVYTKEGWGLEPKEPRIKGKVVFLIDASAMSLPELIMSFVEHYKLGEIVGQPTAGVNGEVNWFTLPGGYRVTWSGMKALKHDGSQHHLIGTQPTVPVKRTIRGVIEGRDEFLEKALEIINQK